MRSSLQLWLFLAAGALSAAPAVAHVGTGVGAGSGAVTEAASPVSDISVTIYRAGYRRGESLDLDELGGFALVTETRTISIPAGVSRLRFEGVADGIQPATAIITGLPSGLLEKNHDAKVLSPAELVTATIGKNVWLVRTNPKTGQSDKVPGSILSDADGVVFKSAAGLEALRCSGLPETFQFDSTLEGAATPTLSALVRSPRATTATVRLSYLAEGFDWMANYVATVAPDGKTMDLGAWVTLANANAKSFPDAHTQVVAGRLNRESEEVDPVDEGAQIVAKCWPRGSTSDTPETPNIVPASPLLPGWDMLVARAYKAGMNVPMPMAASEMALTGARVQQEQLGDLKLYRVPDRTSVASRQIKQVRLLDRKSIPIDLFYRADLGADDEVQNQPLGKILRTRNDKAHHLDLPLPSGQVATFYEREGVPLLVNEAPLRDITLDEEVEIEAGEAPDLRVTAVVEGRRVNGATLKKLPLVPGALQMRSREVDIANRVEITNAGNRPAVVELRLILKGGAQLVRADHIPFSHNGYQTFRLTVPAEGSATVHYQTVDTRYSPEPE
jgi:hypothetical protein